jgi:hypothetical protein
MIYQMQAEGRFPQRIKRRVAARMETAPR